MKEINYKLEIRHLAAIETIEAYDWYENKQEGLGASFLIELDNFYKKLLINPLTHSFYYLNVRSGLIKRFPYVIIYEVFEEIVVIYSVFMGKQNPEKKRTK